MFSRQLKRTGRVLPWFCFILCLGAANSAPERGRDQKPLLGFRPENSARQRELEQKFDALLNRDNLKEWMRRMSAQPHQVGSAYGKENAEFLAGLFRSWGYDTAIEVFEVLFPTPTERIVEMIGPEKFTATLSEPPIPEDRTSDVSRELLPPYNAYSIDGDVTAPLVYVNYGVPKDYEALAERGIEVRGKIVIARYGGSWRGIKPKVAAEHGAIGCLIYSDPRDDGFFHGDVYPKGAWRNERGAQRGSVSDLPLYPGDPLTPGIGATHEAKRLRREEALTLTKIPVLPISSADALPLLRALEGPVAPEDWRGALPITYHLGPGATHVRLKVASDWKIVPAYDVIAKLPGTERPDEWIIRGNHHDAWVLGADDPLSGLVAMLEEARAIGELRKNGWQPKRTVVFAAWDAEEPGLLGSTEWVETHADLLQQKAAIYINSDNTGRGFLHAHGSHSLEKWVNEIGGSVIDPETKIPVVERERARELVHGSPEERRELRSRSDLRIGALGSGSDYTPFLQHLGVASLDLRFGGENGGGSYHSLYDSFDHYNRFGDPGFYYGIALAQTAGRAVLRAADADVLPFVSSNFTETVGQYVKEVVKLADDLRQQTREHNDLLAEKRYQEAADPNQKYVPPKPRAPVPFFNFAPLHNAMTRLDQTAERFQKAWRENTTPQWKLTPAAEKQIEAAFVRAERALAAGPGLPRRPWYKHQIYAPGFYTGYGVKTLPGIREAIEERAWDDVNPQIAQVANVLLGWAREIDAATQALQHAGRSL